MTVQDYTQLSISAQKKLVASLRPEAAQAAADALGKAGAALHNGIDNSLSALMDGHGFEDQFKGAFANRFFHAATLLNRCAYANAETAVDGAKPLSAFAAAMATAKKQCEAKFAELDEAGGAENHPQLAKLVRQEVGQALNGMYQQAPTALPQFEPPARPATDGPPVDPASIGQGPQIPSPQSLGNGGGGAQAPTGGPSPEALAALKQMPDAAKGTGAAADARLAQPQDEAKGAGDAPGQLGQAAGDAGKGLGEGAGKGGGADPSQALAGLADAFKQGGAGDGLGAATDAALPLDDATATEAGYAAAFTAPGAAHFGGAVGSGTAGTAARHLSNAAGHGTVSAPVAPQSAAGTARQDSTQAQNVPPMGMMPPPGGMAGQQAGKTIGANKYLRGASSNKDDFLKGIPVVSEQVIAGDGVVGALTETERTAHVIRLEGEGQFEDELKGFKA